METAHLGQGRGTDLTSSGPSFNSCLPRLFSQPQMQRWPRGEGQQTAVTHILRQNRFLDANEFLDVGGNAHLQLGTQSRETRRDGVSQEQSREWA